MLTPAERRWRIVGLLWLVVVGWSTLRSAPTQAALVATLPWYCIACGQSGVADLLLNLLLFLPLGVAARGAGWPARRTLALLFALTFTIEVIQGTLLVGRDASLGDVLANTTGGMIGWSGYPSLRVLSRPSVRTARSAAAAVVALTAALWIATAAALRPALSDAAPWVGQLTHRPPYHDPFPGALLLGVFNGRRVPEGAMVVTPSRGDSLDLAVDVVRRGDMVPLRPALLLRVIDANQRIQADVTERRDDAIVEFALRGTAWHLHTPAWRFGDALRIPRDRAWHLRWRWRGDRLELTAAPVADSGARRQAAIPFSIALGWVFIHPYVSVVGPSEPLWTALWLAWWFGLLGWCAGWSGTPERWLFGLAAMAIFIAAGMASGLQVSASQLAAAALSFLLTLFAAKQRRRRKGTATSKK